jgi:hypothetical protein
MQCLVAPRCSQHDFLCVNSHDCSARCHGSVLHDEWRQVSLHCVCNGRAAQCFTTARPLHCCYCQHTALSGNAPASVMHIWQGPGAHQSGVDRAGDQFGSRALRHAGPLSRPQETSYSFHMQPSGRRGSFIVTGRDLVYHWRGGILIKTLEFIELGSREIYRHIALSSQRKSTGGGRLLEPCGPMLLPLSVQT